MIHPSKGLQEALIEDGQRLKACQTNTTASWFFDKAAFDEAKGDTAAGAFSLFINEAGPEEVEIQRKAEKRIVNSVVHG